MSVILKKEKIQTGDVICQKYSQTNIECDVIVPDVNPDIMKILDVSGYVSVTEKSIRADKVYIQGVVNMTVLYAPDGDVMSCVKSLSCTRDFNHAIDARGAEEGMQLTAEVDAESFNYSLINSRKVNLRCTAGISIKVTRPGEFEIAVDTESDESICTDSKTIRICNATVNSENRITLCEQLEIPSGKPGIGEILKVSVFPQSLELTLMENKATAAGQVKICTLYTSADDGSVQLTEHTVPFTETLDVDGAEDDMEGEIEYSVSDMYSEIRDDSDGEARIIGIDLGLCAIIRGFRIQELNAICDAYSTNGSVNLESQQVNIEQLVDNTTAQLTHKMSVNLPEMLPRIAQICDISANASVERISAGDGEITVFGKVHCDILYITNDGNAPLGSFSDVSEFTHTIPVPGASPGTICEAKVFTEHVSYTLSGGDSIDMRVVLGLCVRSFTDETLSSVTDIEITGDDSSERKPCITIYFVRSGDTLWNIAKRYRTTVEALKECNNLTNDRLNVGQQIKICRKAS